MVPLRLVVTEEEVEAVIEGVCVPLMQLLDEEVWEAVTHVLCEALSHCDKGGRPLVDCVVLLLCEREGVKLAEKHAEPLKLVVTVEEEEDVHEVDCVPLMLLTAEALCAAV